MDASTSRQRWELENNVQTVGGGPSTSGGEDVDALFKYDPAEQQLIQSQKPWAKDPHHYKK